MRYILHKNPTKAGITITKPKCSVNTPAEVVPAVLKLVQKQIGNSKHRQNTHTKFKK